MFCSSCGHQQAADAQFCTSCGTPVAGLATASAAAGGYGGPAPMRPITIDDGVPPGVKGWSWGAFLLNWVWAIGNSTWIGLLALVPYVGLVVAIWLGVKGREMAWKNRHWDSYEHFDRVQRRWSAWGVGLTLGVFVLGIVAAIVIPAYASYVARAHAAAAGV